MNAAVNSKIYHGGDLREAEARFGTPAAGWLDLSTGINPNAYPDVSIAASSLAQLPQTDALDTLHTAARCYYRVSEPSAIAAAPGSQSVLQLLPGLLDRCAVAVIGPTYGEHAKTWSDNGHSVSVSGDIDDTKDARVVALVNPNNPDGRHFAIPPLLELARNLATRQGLLIIDEAFADCDPATSILPALDTEPVLVVRSFGKFFGLPGLRLGFAAGAPGIIGQLQNRMGPWAVSGPALEIGARALRDDTWIKDTRHALKERCNALTSALKVAGLRPIGGTTLYQLVEDVRAPDIFEELGKAGIFVRRFPDNPRWLRFGIPGTDTDLQRLQRTLDCLNR